MIKSFKKLIILSAILLVIISCSSKKKAPSVKTTGQSGKETVHKIMSNDEFKKIFDNSGDRLLVIDLYADWCAPCRRLSPILENIAQDKKDQADFYKINVDKLRDIAALFNVRSIPHIAFIKNKKVVHSLIGLYPKDQYVNIIDQFSK